MVLQDDLLRGLSSSRLKEPETRDNLQMKVMLPIKISALSLQIVLYLLVSVQKHYYERMRKCEVHSLLKA